VTSASARRSDTDTGVLSTVLTSVQDTPSRSASSTPPSCKNQALPAPGTGAAQRSRHHRGDRRGGTLTGDQFKIRGFDSKDDVYVDGLRDFGAYTRDSFNYEEVRSSKARPGAMFGRGTTGGASTPSSKRPRLETRSASTATSATATTTAPSATSITASARPPPRG
jgi:catecholate siderophore receptor